VGPHHVRQAKAIIRTASVRPEPLEERRKRLSKLLSRKTKAMRDGIQVSEAITGDGAAIFRHACSMDLEGIVSKRIGSRYVSGRTRAWLKTNNPNLERRLDPSKNLAIIAHFCFHHL
jgi:ATP-dependent DNA ligase